MSDPALLRIEGLGKAHGKARVLDDVSFALEPGQRIALLGHNGAGKTTLMKIVLGLMAPNTGRISILGAKPGSLTARKATAYLPEAVSFHRSLTGQEQLTLLARLAGEPSRVVSPLLERVGLSDAAGRRIGTYSKGMRQRLGLAQVLLGRPRLALLDEPTSGLDPISRHDFHAIVQELAGQGTAVLISSHDLTELEARTDRIAILRRGRLVADDSLAALTARAGLPMRLRLTAKDGSVETLEAALGGERVNGVALELSFPAEEKMVRLASIAALGDKVVDMEMTPPSLEDLYRHYSEGSATR